MKLELKHLAPYLPYELKYEFNNVIYYYQHCSTREFDFENSKPILRPLSDLTREIEVNGKKFVPKNILSASLQSLNSWEDLIKHRIIMFDDSQKLFEWHFDVFGLIEKGLAIDINTLKD